MEEFQKILNDFNNFSVGFKKISRDLKKFKGFQKILEDFKEVCIGFQGILKIKRNFKRF